MIDGGFAFPLAAIPPTATFDGQMHRHTLFQPANPGMSLRDYFAAHCPITFSEFLQGWKRTHEASTDEALERYAEFRFEYADAMLTAKRNRPGDE